MITWVKIQVLDDDDFIQTKLALCEKVIAP